MRNLVVGALITSPAPSGSLRSPPLPHMRGEEISPALGGELPLIRC